MNPNGDFCSVLRRQADAAAIINGSANYKNIHGRVSFYTVRGGVIVRAEITGLPIGGKPCENPVFAFHIHGGGNCTGDESDVFKNVGMHYNPNECQHPNHAGDLPPLFGVNGSAFSAFLTDRFTVGEILGRTVIIHASPDDFTTQPAGNAGEKIACGVITPTKRL